MRSLSELRDVDDPAWPDIAAAVAAAAGRVTTLPVDQQAADDVLCRLQVTARSPLGALALNCGGLLIDQGWLRLLGGGVLGLASLADANGLGDPLDTAGPPSLLEVAQDVLGGRFAINGGALPGSPGSVNYFAPDTLDWMDLEMGHGALVQWAIEGDLAAFYADLRWPGWEAEVAALSLDQGISVVPPLWSAQSRTGPVSRRAVPWAELVALQAHLAEQLAELPDGAEVRLRATD